MNALTPSGCARCTSAPASASTSAAQYQPYVASSTTSGFFPHRASTARSAAGLFSIRAVSSFRPSIVIRTSTLRRRCRSIPTTCRPSYASVIVGLLFPGGDGCLPTSSIRQERRPAPSSHHIVPVPGGTALALPPAVAAKDRPGRETQARSGYEKTGYEPLPRYGAGPVRAG